MIGTGIANGTNAVVVVVVIVVAGLCQCGGAGGWFQPGQDLRAWLYYRGGGGFGSPN